MRTEPFIILLREKGSQGNMKTIGIIGGLGPESTIEYYRSIITSYSERIQDGSYPSIIINSIDLKKVLDLVSANELAELADYLVASNTPHIVFDEVRRRSPIRLISIVEATCEAAKALGMKKLGLFGARFTMQGRFYPDVFSREGIALAVPDERDQAYIHHVYLNELVKGIIRSETREQLLTIVDRLKERDHIQGLILGGTELSLILQEPTVRDIPVLDTTRIHAKAIVAEAFLS
jgi:aspartate racemase